MKLNFYNILILLGVFHGVIFSLVLLINPKLKSKINNYLSFTVLALCSSNLQYWFLDTGITLRSEYDNNSLIFIPFEFIILPFFYLFVKEYINKPVKKTQIILLFSPFVSSVLYVLVRNTFSESINTIKALNLIVEYISLLFTVFIIVLLFKALLKHEIMLKSSPDEKVPLKIGWLKRILLLGLLLCLFWFVSLNFLKNFYGSGYFKFYPLWLGISTLLYWIAYASIIQNNIYNDRKEIRKIKCYKKTNQKLNKSKFNELNNLIIDNEFFLNPKLSLSFLS